MKKIFFACALMLSLSALVGCDKDDDPKSGEPNVSSGNIQIGDEGFTAKYAYVINESEYGYNYYDYYFFDKDVLQYALEGKDIDDVDEEFSALYVFYEPQTSRIDDEIYIEYKYNGYRGTGFYVEYDGTADINNYVNLSTSKNNVTVSGKSIPMVRQNVRTGSETAVNVSFSLNANPTDLTDLADFDGDYDDVNTKASIKVKKVTDPKQIKFLKSLRNKRNL